MKVSAVIISFNEEQYIGRCIASLQGVADEILVLDSFSTDQTAEICRSLEVRFEQHPFDGYVSQKNRAVQMATHPWILSLDADEALSEELTGNLKKLISRADQDPSNKIKKSFAAYAFNRRNAFCGRWMRHTSWYPDRKIRLFDRRRAVWRGLDPHDRVLVDKGERVKRVRGDIYHWAVDSVPEFKEKMDHFARISARAYHNAGISAAWWDAPVHGGWRWIREYILRLGFLEGRAGWLIARYSAMNASRKYLYLRKLNKHNAP